MKIVYSSKEEEQEPDEDCRGCPLPLHLTECYFYVQRDDCRCGEDDYLDCCGIHAPDCDFA